MGGIAFLGVLMKVCVDQERGRTMLEKDEDVGKGVYSELGDDFDLADIVALFVEEMPTRVATLLKCLENGDEATLRQVAHQLMGAAGSYGFGVVSEAAGRVENAIRCNGSEEQIRRAVVELIDLCGRMRTGRPVV